MQAKYGLHRTGEKIQFYQQPKELKEEEVGLRDDTQIKILRMYEV